MKKLILIIIFLLGSLAIGQNLYVPMTNTIEQNSAFYNPPSIYYAPPQQTCPYGCLPGECSCWRRTGNHWTHNGECSHHIDGHDTPLLLDCGAVLMLVSLAGAYYLYLYTKDK